LALDKEFVLKYKDTDGDLITLTSNEELACALSYSDGNLLRLVAVPNDQASVAADSEVCSSGGWEHMHGGHGPFPGGFGWDPRFGGCPGWEHMHGGRGGHGWEHMRGGHGHFHGGRGCHGWEHMRGGHGQFHGGCRAEMFKARLTSKRDFFKSQLDELEKVTEKNSRAATASPQVARKIEKNRKSPRRRLLGEERKTLWKMGCQNGEKKTKDGEENEEERKKGKRHY